MAFVSAGVWGSPLPALPLPDDFCLYCSAFEKEISHVRSDTMFHRNEDAGCSTFTGSRGDGKVGNQFICWKSCLWANG